MERVEVNLGDPGEKENPRAIAALPREATAGLHRIAVEL